MAFLAALIARDGASLAELAGSKAESSSFVDTLFSVLASCTSSSTSDLLQLIETGDIELKQAGMTKRDHGQVPSTHGSPSLCSRSNSLLLFMTLLLLDRIYSVKAHL